MKKLFNKCLTFIALFPLLAFGQTTPSWQQTLKVSSTASIAAAINLTTASTLSISTGGNTTINAPMTAFPGGPVEIGTGTFQSNIPLQVNGTNGQPVNSGSTQTYGLFRIDPAGKVVLDFGASSNSVWMQSGDGTDLSDGSYGLRINPNHGFVGIGTGTVIPTASLEVDGSSGSTLRIVDGNQSSGYVLTSSSTGQASWQAPATAGTVTSVNAGTNLTITAGTSTVNPTLSTITDPTFSTSVTSPLILGGTGTTSTLTIQSTSGVGVAGANILFKGGNNGASEYARIAGSGAVTQTATGGTQTTDGSYTVCTFTTSGTFTPAQNMLVDYLVVAGGGAGGHVVNGNAYASGGGGAGGFKTGTGLSVTNIAYTITIGAGGTSTTSTETNGNASSFGSLITTTAGGKGAFGDNGGANTGGTGGSGGGGATTAGSGTSGEGSNGGSGSIGSGGGGGGGGAGAVGSNGGGNGGNGGTGTANSYSGASVTYAGGGGGGGYGGGTGGTASGGGGAGGNGGVHQGSAATANTGAGGGGSGGSSSNASASAGGAGASGIIIIRFLTSVTPPATFGIGTSVPSSLLTLGAGAAAQNSAPLKFIAGTNLTSVETGAVEYDGTNLYFSPATTRQTFGMHSKGTLTAQATISVPFETNNTWALTPTGAETLNATGGVSGMMYSIVITTSGVTSYTITFGTNFKTTGTLATGTTTAKVYTINFVYDGTNFNEVSRTTAM